MPADLFSTARTHPQNLLSKDGEVFYFGRILSPEQADYFYQTLLNTIPWQVDQLWLFGKRISTARKVAWYADKPYRYTYSKVSKHALAWTTELLTLKQLIERERGLDFNACLLNLYHHGQEGMAWHCDDEPDLQKHAAIASLSLGAERKFSFKHKQSKEQVAVLLQHGSLLVMQGETQSHWLHQLPKTRAVTEPRINLTFRTIAHQEPF